ncbi:MAG: hypothetical protein KDC48_21325 [Planctomycetes bacterium]|nr:hypothetical protein [Planctomycetota bacterium]
MAGSDAHIARYANGVVERMPTPGLGKHIVFGLWAAAPDDAWAVGAIAGRNGFIWHYDGAAWTDVPLPDDIPLDNQRDVPAFFKVTGTSADDIWVVGARGIALNGSAERGFHVVDTGTTDALFTVATDGDRVVSVGGVNNAVAFDMVPGSTAIPIAPSPLLQGVAIDARGAVWAAGAGGRIARLLLDGSR